MSLIFVDCEAWGGCPTIGQLTEFGAVSWPERLTFHGVCIKTEPDPNNPACPRPVLLDRNELIKLRTKVATEFEHWLSITSIGRPIMVSDNPAFDFQWINDLFLTTIGRNPFGHSARRIGDFWAGLNRNFRDTSKWKRYRVTPHDHNPVNDALGNVEAFAKMLELYGVNYE